MPLNVLDIVLLVLIAGGTWLGYSRGFVAQFVSIAGFFLAYIAAFVLSDDAVPWVRMVLPLPAGEGFTAQASLAFVEPYIYRAIAFIVIFAVVKLGWVWVGRLLNFIARGSVLSAANRWSGALLGLTEATLLVVLAVHLLSLIPAQSVLRLFHESEIASYIIQYSPAFADKLQFLWSRIREAAIIITIPLTNRVHN